MLIQCSATTIARYLTSIVAKIHTYADLETCMIAKYSKQKRQVMWEISKLVQREFETAATFFDCVEMLKSQVVGITDDFL